MTKRAALIATFLVSVALAQPSFEVASVKPSPLSQPGARVSTGCRGGPGSSDPGFWNCTNVSLGRLILIAYDLKTFQLEGPAWLNDNMFDIAAKVPEGATAEQLKVLEQNLLAERFKVALHHEKRDLPIYEMTVAKNGPKLRAATSGSQVQFRPGVKSALDKDDFPVRPPGWTGFTVMSGRTQMGLGNGSMDRLASSLTLFAGRPVVNATGVTGAYDIVLTWTTEAPGAFMTASAGGGSPAGTPAAEPGPSLIQACQEQLGLKLESKKGPVDVVVIDHAEKQPIGN